MKIGVFSIIPWSYLDQRPQVMAKNLASWGHDVVYVGTFDGYKHWNDIEPHPWDEYKKISWEYKKVMPRLHSVNPISVEAHNRFAKIYSKNEELDQINEKKIKEMNLDLAVVIGPRWGRILKKLGIPFIYDHVDDTHHMDHVMTEEWHAHQVFCERNAVKNIFIQPNIAERYNGLFVANGVNPSDLKYKKVDKKFDAVCLSAYADWFDCESVFSSSKSNLLIGPMEPEVYEKYKIRKSKDNVLWLDRLPRSTASMWLNYGHVGVIPFDQNHGIIDYVMPLKIVEYFYLGLPAVCYVNKAVQQLFGDHVYSYSPTGWLGNPSYDNAIENAKSDARIEERRKMAMEYTWDKVLRPFKDYIDSFENGSLNV